MAWMLMTESPLHAPARIEPRTARATGTMRRTASTSPDSPSPVGLTAAGHSRAGAASAATAARDAWILFGDVERALLQAGMLDVLIGVLPEPSRIYASGIAVANALLAVSGERDGIMRGWESLRSAHFLIPAALMRVPTLAHSTALASQLESILSRTILKAGLPSRRPALLAVTSNGFEQPAGPSGVLLTARLRETLSRDDNVADSIATTISVAAGTGVERIYVFGLDPRLRGHPLVAAAMRAVSAAPPDLTFIGMDSSDTPGALSYLLPGSGGPDRLVRDGRLAARRWLETTRSAQPVADRRPASV
jgi:hypothetical protein